MEIELQEGLKGVSYEDYRFPKKKQFRALFLKNASLQRQQKCTNCCQITLPLLVIVIIGAINVIIKNSSFTQNDNTGKVQTTASTPLAPYGLLYQGSYPWFMYVNQAGKNLGTLENDGTHSGFLGSIPQIDADALLSGRPSFNVSGETNMVPFFVPYETQEQMDATIEKVKLARERDAVVYAKGYPRSSEYYPGIGIIFQELNLSAKYIVEYESSAFQFGTPSQPRTAVGSAMTAISDAIIKAIWPYLSLTTNVQGFPYLITQADLDVSGLLAGFLFPFAFSFLLPVYTYSITLEKQEKLREMMKMNGMHMIYYWGINFIYNFIIYIILTLIVILVGVAFGLNFFTKTSPLIIVLLFLGWGLNQVTLGFLLSTFFSKGRTATIVCYLLIIFSILISYAVSNAVFPTGEANIGYLLWPPFAFYRGISNIGNNCFNNACPQTADIAGGELSSVFQVLFIESLIFAVFTLYLDEVMPREFGVRKSPFFIFDIFRKRRTTKIHHYSSLVDNTDVEDHDVAEERKFVNDFKDEDIRKFPVIIDNLNKQYHDKVAVKNTCLHLTNECFGLLGPNGAGKTTTISMLTGLFMPTKGTAYVAGLDIRTDMDKIHQLIGICPQFDLLWESLTVEETLLFYVRLKGATPKEENDVVKKILASVGLADASTMLVSELSGGMKRRLSVAVSLAGDPKVLFLDEPTTGLDPDTRRQLWNVLLELKKGRCVIITTHSMEEADVLCNRIGIMSRGSLKCLGSNVYLKNKFGEGYSLKINFNPDDTSIVEAGISKVLPRAKLEESFPGNHTYRIPNEGFKMSELLENLFVLKDQFKLSDWGISQTSLEDVFLNIVKNDEVMDEKLLNKH